jgi:hypothetical protein
MSIIIWHYVCPLEGSWFSNQSSLVKMLTHLCYQTDIRDLLSGIPYACLETIVLYRWICNKIDIMMFFTSLVYAGYLVLNRLPIGFIQPKWIILAHD